MLWVSTYFGGSRYDGRHWRGYAQQEGGLPSDFNNNIKGRSAQEALYCSDKGLGIITDAPNEDATWVAYTRDPETGRGRAKVTVGGKVVEDVDMPLGVPHSFMISADVDGNDIWVGTSKGLGWGIGDGLLPGHEGAAALRVWTPRRPEARERRPYLQRPGSTERAGGNHAPAS